MSQTIPFSCTMCGKCCHDLRLPLGVDEAIEWVRDGGDVQLFCEAIPWPNDPPPEHLEALYKRGKSFAALSGVLPVRVAVTLVASFDGPCRHLQPDMRCGVYAKRPRVCRIYPAEINPFVKLTPENKKCPPDAWSAGGPVLMHGEVVVDSNLRHFIEQSREADRLDVAAKARVCATLGIDIAALANEGFAVHAPRRELVLEALVDSISTDREPTVLSRSNQWQLVSNRSGTLTVLNEIGARVINADASPHNTQYIAFHPTE
ncbi:YkgJ family cysteine cluster protein [Paraburkholderia flagellata]|uniref:YkgJ family cysteine cluster protein n=1 Tax=Paraburkholderia flagellata TaxID=2883241 RepID=UPI001F28C3D0|nr:YkgJ family cysteine cluster protein [Paraburkholderia flagellata]